MQQTETAQRVEQYREYIKEATEAIKDLDELIPALANWPRKLIDKNFFAQKVFQIEREGWHGAETYSKYHLSTPSYSFEKYAYQIYLNRSYKVELQDRETFHVLEACKSLKNDLVNRLKEYEDTIADLESVDESALIRDLQAVYFKHNKPQIWGRILDSYKVKYPKDN